MSDTVLISGAGPTGLATAVHLALHQIPVRVIDAAESPATTSRALGLQSRGAEVLERIGALGDLPERSQELLTMSYNEGPRTVLRLQVGRAVGAMTKPTLLISQAEVEGALRRRLEELGGTVEWDHRLVDASQSESGVTATVHAHGTERHIDASWLIGCDGAHSMVRRIASIDFPGRRLIDRLLMIDVRADWPYDRNGSTTWMETGRMLSVTALPDSGWRVFSEAGPGTPTDLPAAQITERVLSEFSRRSGTAIDTVEKVLWASEFRIHRRLATAYRRGRLLIAGDAAHIQSPTGGQGQNTGLGDAENLGWKLALVASGRADPQLLDTYEAERRPLARNVLAATSTAVTVMLPENRWQRALRDRIVMPAIRLPQVQRRLLAAASQLRINYRSGPLGGTSFGWAPSPRPGDRVPEARCRTADGTEITLHAAIGGAWVVLASTAEQLQRFTATAASILGSDQVGGLVRTSAGSTDVFLIRPDGHLGWRGHRNPTRMAEWLNQVLWPLPHVAGARATLRTTPPSSMPRSTS